MASARADDPQTPSLPRYASSARARPQQLTADGLTGFGLFAISDARRTRTPRLGCRLRALADEARCHGVSTGRLWPSQTRDSAECRLNRTRYRQAARGYIRWKTGRSERLWIFTGPPPTRTTSKRSTKFTETTRSSNIRSRASAFVGEPTFRRLAKPNQTGKASADTRRGRSLGH